MNTPLSIEIGDDWPSVILAYLGHHRIHSEYPYETQNRLRGAIGISWVQLRSGNLRITFPSEELARPFILEFM